MRIVYDCSAKTHCQVLSLNNCLEVGPPLHPMLFDILLRNRLKMLCITGDIHPRVDPRDRDALHLLWYENLDSRTVRQYYFTRVIFGSGPSPYILGATIQKHVSQYADKYLSTADELLKNTCGWCSIRWWLCGRADQFQRGGHVNNGRRRVSPAQVAQQHSRIRRTTANWWWNPTITSKLNLRKVSGWNPFPRNKDTWSTLKQGRRHNFSWFHKVIGNNEWWSPYQEKDVISHKWCLWLVGTCSTSDHHGKDPVQWGLLKEAKVGPSGTRRYTKILEQLAEGNGEVSINKCSEQCCE